MSTVPKIVRDRLKATPPAVNHPGADVLTAFAEQSLPERERATVIEHLASCGDCRDVIALALPPTESVAATTSTHRRAWLTWPTLRWAFVAAGVVAIVSFGVMRLQRKSELALYDMSPRPQASSVEARNEAPAPTAAVSAAKEDKAAATSAQAEFPSSSNQNADALLPKPAPSPNASLVHRPQGTGGAAGGYAGARVGGPVMPSQEQTATQQTLTRQGALSKQRADSTLALQAPSASEAVEVAGQANQVAVEAENQKTELRDQPAPPPAEFDAYSGGVGKAKPATPEAARAASAPAPPMPTAAKAQLAAAKSLPPRWTISAAGGLQRSVDQGNTWQDVNVLAGAAVSENFMSYSISSDTTSTAKVARSKEKDADKKSLKQESLTFRAVTAIGSDVWAGGQQGILYHSIDAGAHWTRVVPASAGAFLTGDVLTLEFLDAQHGRITTSTAESWTTSDAGQTWQKQ